MIIDFVHLFPDKKYKQNIMRAMFVHINWVEIDVNIKLSYKPTQSQIGKVEDILKMMLIILKQNYIPINYIPKLFSSLVNTDYYDQLLLSNYVNALFPQDICTDYKVSANLFICKIISSLYENKFNYAVPAVIFINGIINNSYHIDVLPFDMLCLIISQNIPLTHAKFTIDKILALPGCNIHDGENNKLLVNMRATRSMSQFKKEILMYILNHPLVVNFEDPIYQYDGYSITLDELRAVWNTPYI
jgi:hypothetical protein